MSLDWNIGNIKDYTTVCWVNEGEERLLNPITNAIIWTTLVVDIGKITKQNIDEWIWRLAYQSQLDKGKLVYENNKYRDPSRKELEDHINLSTNVTTLTRRQFVGKMQSILKRNADAAVTRSYKYGEA